MELVPALTQLGDLLEARRQHFDLLVIGGSALVMEGLIERATRDVDAVAVIRNGTLESASPLPEDLVQAVLDIASIHADLPDDWLNGAPTQLLDVGLPEGILDRARTITYGGLTLRIASRLDQIHFKLYAATDQYPGTSKHDQDLAALKPSADELAQAAEWCRRQDPSAAFDEVLRLTMERNRGR